MPTTAYRAVAFSIVFFLDTDNWTINMLSNFLFSGWHTTNVWKPVTCKCLKEQSNKFPATDTFVLTCVCAERIFANADVHRRLMRCASNTAEWLQDFMETCLGATHLIYSNLFRMVEAFPQASIIVHLVCMCMKSVAIPSIPSVMSTYPSSPKFHCFMRQLCMLRCLDSINEKLGAKVKYRRN